MLSALLVDDEPLANDRMRSLLAAHGGVEVAAVAGSVTGARAVLEDRPPDVVFLDVEMPGCTGLDLLPCVPAGTQVVFVTAHDTYAVEAFAASALDYLVKPVNPERLSETLRRLEEMKALLRLKASTADQNDATASKAGINAAGAAGTGLGDTIHVPLEGRGRSATVTVGDICWIESFRNYSRVGLKNPGRIILFRRRLGEWEEDLPAGLFERLGKSLTVQTAAIQQTEWKSRDEMVLTFADDLEPLVIGRIAAMRLRDILTAEGGG